MKYNQGWFHPQNPQKYVGDPTNIVYRSGLEFRLMRYFDTQSSVVQWASEELKIPYIRPDDQRMHYYYPDFLVRVARADKTEGTILIEVKPAKQCTLPPQPKTRSQHKRYLSEVVTFAINTAKWKAAEAWCKVRGADFLILTEQEILGQVK